MHMSYMLLASPGLFQFFYCVLSCPIVSNFLLKVVSFAHKLAIDKDFHTLASIPIILKFDFETFLLAYFMQLGYRILPQYFLVNKQFQHTLEYFLCSVKRFFYCLIYHFYNCLHHINQVLLCFYETVGVQRLI